MMSLTRLLPISIFFVAVAIAWNAAQPPVAMQPPPTEAVVPSAPSNDAVNTQDVLPRRVIVAPPEPVKFSEDPFR